MTPEERLARLEALAELQGADVHEIKQDIKKLVAAVEQARGGWRGLYLALSIAVVLGGTVTWMVDHLIRG